MLIIESGMQGEIRLSGNKETCPGCGGWAELPDGTFDVIGDAIHVLSMSDLTRERLLRLQTILKAASEGRISEEEADEAVAAEAPEVASLLQRLRPKMGRALIFFVSTAISILATQAIAEHRDHAATPTDIQHAVEQAVQECKTQQP
jgi:hypothetical protein